MRVACSHWAALCPPPPPPRRPPTGRPRGDGADANAAPLAVVRDDHVAGQWGGVCIPPGCVSRGGQEGWGTAMIRAVPPSPHPITRTFTIVTRGLGDPKFPRAAGASHHASQTDDQQRRTAARCAARRGGVTAERWCPDTLHVAPSTTSDHGGYAGRLQLAREDFMK